MLSTIYEYKQPAAFQNIQVQDQARERRRSDRKEKRELDKEKSLAEYKARALEGTVRRGGGRGDA